MGLLAFVCYWHTLLPGLDFGDTASFQTGVGSLSLTPRQAYPLYYALGNLVAWLDPREPAHAMNLASAIYGALATGIAVWVASDVTGAVVGGVAAGLFLAFSYTFWTQAIIAEVYTLHLLLIGLCLMALLAWERAPTRRRLAVFYAIYALGFGNHLSMILLLPGCALFILTARPRGDDNPLRPRLIAMALGIAALGALQYAWNFRGLWLSDPPPSSLSDALGTFWFDVTKADWRQTLVLNVSDSGLQNRPAMYWFDLHQQFGVPGVLLAIAGFVFIVTRRWRVATLLFLLYLVNLAFAWTYNVGDVHVFFLPSHYIVALCAGAGVVALHRLISFSPQPSALSPARRVVSASALTACLLYAAWRGYDTLPAVDRSWDTRAVRVMDQITADIVPTSRFYCAHAILGLDANWQVQNAVEYYMKRAKPDVPWFTTGELPWLNGPNGQRDFIRFVNRNFYDGRQIVLTLDAKLKTGDPGSSNFEIASARQSAHPLADDELWSLPKGALYALTVLRPYKEYPIDRDGLAMMFSVLTGKREVPALSDYAILIGRIGDPPTLFRTGNRPFRVSTTIASSTFDVRMESWLPTDTIRRAGFGHVIVNRTHMLASDRGVSLVAFVESGAPILTFYRSGLYAPVPRFVVGPHESGPPACYR